MAVPQKVKVNTFFEGKQTTFEDQLSKLYFLIECILGLNRLPVLFKNTRYFFLINSLSCMYSITLACVAIYITVKVPVLTAIACEYLFCITFSFISWKRVDRYFKELNEFDDQIGCKPKTTDQSSRHFVSVLILTGFALIFYFWFNSLDFSLIYYSIILMAIVRTLHCFETSYYGHLLSLMVPRIQMINYYMESSLSNGHLASRPDVEKLKTFDSKHKKNSELKKLMDLYHTALKAFDIYMDAVKWQLLMILIASFVWSLQSCYVTYIAILKKTNPLQNLMVYVSMVVIDLLPLFSPCVFGDRVHGEVRRLREMIATRLYEKKLDKSGRSTARSLLGLTEARDLSFSLLRMLRVDVSLPFKFIGLIVTYLIILLQFDKVIRPSSSNENTTVASQI